MRAGEPLDRRWQEFGAAVGSRSQGYSHLDPRAARLWPAVQGKIGQLDVSDRARAGPERTSGVSAAWKSARRLEFDQRTALRSRPARGLRSLAPARQCRLGL